MPWRMARLSLDEMRYKSKIAHHIKDYIYEICNRDISKGWIKT